MKLNCHYLELVEGEQAPRKAAPKASASSSSSCSSGKGKLSIGTQTPTKKKRRALPKVAEQPQQSQQQQDGDEQSDDTPIDKKHKLVPDGDDFKIVFISSDSSKESDQLNSSLEANSPENKPQQQQPDSGEYIEDSMIDWTAYNGAKAFMAASSPKAAKKQHDDVPPALPPKKLVRAMNVKLDDVADPLRLKGSSSSSVNSTIRTAATKGRGSPALSSPRIPKVHMIPIERVENSESALDSPKRHPSQSAGDFNAASAMADLHNNSAEVAAILGHPPGLVVPLPASLKSYGDRSLEELSIHDQLLLLKEEPASAEVEQYRSYLLAELALQAGQSPAAANARLSRSLSESDVSELCAAEQQQQQQQQQAEASLTHLYHTEEATNIPKPVLPPKTRRKLHTDKAIEPEDPEFRSEFHLSLHATSASGIQRSASSVGSKPAISKPVRRSKSHLLRGTHTHSIQHGGPVTFVSVNNTAVTAHTLPRLRPRRANKSESDQDLALDSDVIITRNTSAGGNGVRIHIGSGGNKHAEKQEPGMLCDMSSSTHDPQAKPRGRSGEKRKYTLEELEVEGFEASPTTSEAEESAKAMSEEEDEEEMFDLNSLIEGAVDDEEPELTQGEPQQTRVPRRDTESSGRSQQSRIERVDDEETPSGSEDEELLSMAVHQGSLKAMVHREGDFLDRTSSSSAATVTSAVARAQQRLNGSIATKASPKPSPIAKRQLPQPLPLTRGLLNVPLPHQQIPHTHQPLLGSHQLHDISIDTAASDMDSLSTTSASYLVNPCSDLDSLHNVDEATPAYSLFPEPERACLAAQGSASEAALSTGSSSSGSHASVIRRRARSDQGEEAHEEADVEEEEVRRAQSAHELSRRRRSTSSPPRSRPEREERRGGDSHRKGKSPDFHCWPQGQEEKEVIARAASLGDLLSDADGRRATNSNNGRRKGSVHDLIAKFEGQRSPSPERRKPKASVDQDSDSGEAKTVSNENVSEQQQQQQQPVNLPLGAEALPPELTEEDYEDEDEMMAQTLPGAGRGPRHNSGGYTSYVFISSSEPSKDEVSSVSSASSRSTTKPENKVVVNVKESGSNCVVLQDGRASNISIVSTESSDLGSPNSPIEDLAPGGQQQQQQQQVAAPPELPAKIRSRQGGVIDMQHHFMDAQDRDYLGMGRNRGGERVLDPRFLDEELAPEPEEDVDDDSEASRSPSGERRQQQGSGLANYFTSSLEAPSPGSQTRRGRPPVIRAADRAARTRGQPLANRDYDPDMPPYEADEEAADAAGYELDGHTYHRHYEEGLDAAGGGEEEDGAFHIRELPSDPEEMYDDVVYSDEAEYHHDYDPQLHYDVQYESGESEGDYDDAHHDYPMCQPVYDDSDPGEYAHDADEFFDREEELRGYNRQIDFTLHTIIEESCEDSESEPRSLDQDGQRDALSRKRQSDPSELEKYFFYGVGGGHKDDDFSDTYSETSLNTTGGGAGAANGVEDEFESLQAEALASTRYERYLAESQQQVEEQPQQPPQQPASLLSERHSSDDSGSVGSESDGHGNQDEDFPGKKKRFVRQKQRGSDPDDAPASGDLGPGQYLSSSSESSTTSELDNSRFALSDGQFDTVKRKKKQMLLARRGSSDSDSRRPSAGSGQLLRSLERDEQGPKGASPTASEPGDATSSASAAVKPSPPANGPVRKHKSRDSGFVGSLDDLLRSEAAAGAVQTTSSDSGHSVSDGESGIVSKSQPQQRLEKVSEVSENTEDEMAQEVVVNAAPEDREHDAMTSRLRAFFQALAVNDALQGRLSRLMCTVPGLHEEQVRDTVSYLASEQAWGGSDFYDAEYRTADLFERETALIYHRLMARGGGRDSLQLVHQVSTRLVALMHEVHEEEEDDVEPDSIISETTNFADRRYLGPPTRRFKRASLTASQQPEEQQQAEQATAKVPSTTNERQRTPDYDMWPSQRRGAGAMGISSYSQREAESLTNDEERWSWKGSFDSAEQADLSQHYPDVTQTLPRELSKPYASSTTTTTTTTTTSGGGSGRYSTNSLPRLGTSAIKAKMAAAPPPPPPPPQSMPPTTLMTSTATVTLASSLSAGPRSARYRPPGYKSSRRAQDLRNNDDLISELSSKSGSASPAAPHRDFRESSVASRSSVTDNSEPEYDLANAAEKLVLRDERFPSPFNKQGSISSLGSRSESMASVYSQEGGRYGTVVVRGSVEFSMVYNYTMGQFEVGVKQCKDLAPVDAKRNRSDPYVKVYLLPDKSKSGKRKTKVKKHTLNPCFDEVLKFQLPWYEVKRRSLWLTVWHSDMFGRNDFLGEVIIPLTSQFLDDPEPKWFNLQDRSDLSSEEAILANSLAHASASAPYHGELIVAMKFVPPPSESSLARRNRKSKGMLMVLIKEAKGLVPPKGATHIDPFCKCYLLPEKSKSGKQKTNVCRRTHNPKWEYTLTWDSVSLLDLADRSLEVTVWDHDRLAHNEMMGGVRFNLGQGKHQGKPSPWMDSNGKEVTLWQQMLDRPNFWVEGSVALRPTDKMTYSHAQL